ncbi:MAG: hypothetical protein EOO38_03165 [Cytophagaceae bacterium]|nr:MAG: hypothetical protein EOO38_03165 [Cytophagaceae bacterium]
MNTETLLVDTSPLSLTKALLPINERSVASAMLTVADTRPGIDMQKLIGQPHIFARFKDLREGFLIEPIGTMTLQPDGRVTGYGHPNEGSWIPYEHSPVDKSQAFAFITAHNRWIPSSTWTHSLGDIPIGYFCDEPESSSALQKLCLIPHHKVASPPPVTYLVASCLAFYKRTVPVLLQQMYDEGIESNQIKVVVNGCAEDSNQTIDGVEYAFSTHNAWEWSTLYEAPLRWKFDYGFLMHDTNVIFPGFRRCVESFNRHLVWDHLPASPLARCLLGLYSHSFLLRLNAWLKGVNHISKKQGVIAEAAGELLLRARSALVIGDPERNGGARSAEWQELVDHFNTGTPRVRRVFPAIKLHKFIHAGPANPEML